MTSLSVESSVNYAKSLLPETLQRSISSVQSIISRRILPVPRSRCFHVCSHNRQRTSNLYGPSLNALLDQAASSCLVSSQDLTLVLEEDGTRVDCDGFFLSLPGHTALMVLERDQVWTRRNACPTSRKPHRTGIASMTLDLYKLHAQEFLGCLSVRATFYDMYSFSYDLSCTRAKPAIKGSVRLLTHTARLAGQLLLYGASTALSAIREEEEEEEEDDDDDDDAYFFDSGH